MTYSLVETVGIEVETERIFPSQLPPRILNDFQITHDSSIETRAFVNSLFKIYNESSEIRIMPFTRTSVLGTEIVSIPIDTEQPYLEKIKNLCNVLVNLGEPEKGTRSGLHIHVNFSYNLTILKAVIRLGKYLEDIFFTLGGNGYKYRGEITDGVHCRPITSYGPPCVRNRRGNFVQIFDIKDLLETKSVKEFWERYGSVNPENVIRHHPVRYTWLNLMSLLQHGTLEFRVFNKTLNPYYIMAEIEFCKAFCQFCLGGNFNLFKELNLLGTHSIFDSRSKTEIIDTFNYFTTIIELNPKIKEILLDILYRTPVPRLNPGFIHSHLRYTRNMGLDPYYFGESYSPNEIDLELIRDPKFEELR